MTRQEHIDRLLAEYARRRAEDERDREERIEKTRADHPEIAAILDESRDLLSESARQLAARPGSGKELAARVRERSAQLTGRLQASIRAAGLPEDILSLRPKCPLCKDLGYTEDVYPRRFCSCFEAELARAMSDETAREQSFDTFRLDVFPDTPPREGAVSQRKMAEGVRRYLAEYAEKYPDNQRPNVTLLGKSGLGKTFFLNCVAARLRDRGVPVVQLTAFRMLEAMRRRHMGSFEARDAFDDMLEAPVLILDDLGSEPMLNNITIEYLFTLLNERSAAGRHTLVATNLSMAELRQHYNERIASRLLDRQRGAVILLEGEDLRTL